MIRALALIALVGGAAAKKGPPFAELKKDFAAGEFERVIRRADAALNAGAEPRTAAQLQLWKGQALLALGREDRASDAFAHAVEAWPDVELDTQRASPDAVRVFEKARQSVPGTLAVSVSSEDATVQIDEKDLGPAPLVAQLTTGKHLVVARGREDRSARVEVEVRPGRKQELVLELTAPPPPTVPEPVAAQETPAEPSPPRALVLEEAAPATPSAHRSRIGLVPLIGGLVAGAAGGVLLWQAYAAYAVLDDQGGPAPTAEQAQAALRNGPVLQVTGWAAVGVGALGTVAGMLMLLFAPDVPAQAGAFLVPGGAGVEVSAPLP